jgi:hypothetical protein
MHFFNYDFDGVFSHIFLEWNNISDLTPVLQKENTGVLVRGAGAGQAPVIYSFAS